MIYVTSDIHGCYDKFLKLLEEIKFSENDILYILGDIIDRGDKSIEMIKYVMKHNNIIMLLGNHESMMIEAYENKDFGLWLYNGGHKVSPFFHCFVNIFFYYFFEFI